MKEVTLGLDISTSKVGLCIMDYKFNLLETVLIKLNTKDELEDRCLQIEEFINNLKYNITSIYIESAYIAFSASFVLPMILIVCPGFVQPKDSWITCCSCS